MISQAPLTFVLIALVLGVIIFALLRWQYRERLQQRDEIIAGYKEKLGLAPTPKKSPAMPLAVEEMNPPPHDPNLVARLRILSPRNKWRVGSRITIRGSVFPENSRLQLLIQPWNEAWFVQNDIQVTGCAWSYNYRLREHTHYKVVAIHGTSLKDSQYDEIPQHVIKSEVINITQDPNQSDLMDCFDKRLHQTKIEDKSQIDDLVIVCGVRYQKHQEGNAPPHIEFVFCILNMSLIPVSVESIEGQITYYIDGEFYEAKLPPTLELKHNASRLGFRQTGWFKVQQDFKTEKEENHLLNAPPDTTLFQFNALKIQVTWEDCSMTLNTSNVSFKKRDNQWLQRDEIDFVLASGAKEQRKILESGNAAFREIARIDREHVEQVVFASIRTVDFSLLESEGRLDFLFDIFNGSLYPISISAHLSGWVYHRNKELSQYAQIEGGGQSDDLPRGKTSVLTIRQERIPIEKRTELLDELEVGGVEFSLLPLDVGVRVTDEAGAGRRAKLQLPEIITCRKGIRVNLTHTRTIFETVYPVPTISVPAS
ncbi:MAG: hypothetical protein QOD75_2119 [Blastocatellia bacterium]|nr:hypothetical protein [Blastocatellia bacterium]